jgi:formate dehydrogenase beta subunit
MYQGARNGTTIICSHGPAAMLMASGPWNEALLTELSTAMHVASICGLGQAAPNPLLSVLKYFSEELKTPLGSW